MKMVTIGNCRDCPYFDDVYYTYMEFCDELGRHIPKDQKLMIHVIPDDCPLPDKEWDEEEQ